MYNTERTVDECRIKTVGDNMTTTKTSKISLTTFDDKRLFVNNNNIKSYPHDENLYLFKRDIVNKICEAGWGGQTLLHHPRPKPLPRLRKHQCNCFADH